MIPSLLLVGLLLSSDTPQVAPKSTDLAAYHEVRARAGRDVDSQIRLALWCESHGMDSERLKHLAMAVLTDPTNALARSLMGLVSFRGRWLSPEVIRDHLRADEAYNAALSEYNARRVRVSNTADAHWRLAVWCDEKGLRAEAAAHLTNVIQLDPGRDAAWRRLGYKKVKGRWVTDAMVSAARADAEAQKAADKLWKPTLSKWRTWLSSKDATRRDEATRLFAALTDPRAVPSLWLTFASGSATGQRLLVQTLGQVDSPGATRALAMLAVASERPEIRGLAASTLQRRDPTDFVDMMIGMIREPINYQVQPVGGPGSPEGLFVKGQQFNVQRLYQPPAMPEIPLFPGESIGTDQYGQPVISRMLGVSNEVIDERHFRVAPSQYFGGAPASGDVARAIQNARQNPQSVQHQSPLFQRWLAPVQLAAGNQTMYSRQNIQVPDKFVEVQITESTTARTDTNIQIPIGQIAMEYQKSASSAQEQLKNDIWHLERYNGDVRLGNDRVFSVLKAVTDVDLGDHQDNRRSWWADAQGYTYNPPADQPGETYVEDVPLPYYPGPVSTPYTRQQSGPGSTRTIAQQDSNPVFGQQLQAAGFRPGTLGHSCFRAGTPIQTMDRLVPVEQVRLGDQVLTIDVQSGVMSYQPVVAVYHNRASSILAIDLGGETIGATLIHRFWKSGRGWTMARDLKPGDRIRTVNGSVRVLKIDPMQAEPVFNLKVAGGHDFFVGQRGALVHDNSLVEPVLSPFDAIAVVSTEAGK